MTPAEHGALINEMRQRPAVEILARTIWGEARGEGKDTKDPVDDFLAMLSVGQVILNRMRIGGWWGSTVPGVCLNPGQFSCWNRDDPNLMKLRAVTEAEPEYALAYGVASILLRYYPAKLNDMTNGATHYYAKWLPKPPVWWPKMTEVARVGRHLFGKETKVA